MNIEYREPTNIAELDSLFRLRQTIYAGDEELNKMVSSTASHDISAYDLNALHFGAFDGKKAIAYIRITTLSNTRFTPWIGQILKETGIKIGLQNDSFPFQSYYPDLDWSNNFVCSLIGKKVGEVGKLAIHKNYRQAGVVLEGLMTSFIQYCIKDQKIETGFGSCTLELERYYRKFGFTVADGAKPFIYEDLPEAIILRFDSNKEFFT